MAAVNRAILLGNLGMDPQTRETAAGATTQFSLATTRRWTDKQGQRQEKTQWHRIVTWGKLAEVCSAHLSKGDLAYVEGSIESREFDDAEGQKRHITEIKALTVQFLGGKPDTARRPAAAAAPHVEDGDVPF